MTASAIVTGGRICDPTTIPAPILNVSEPLEAVVEADPTIAGTVGEDAIAGTVETDPAVSGTVADDAAAGVVGDDHLTAVVTCEGEVIVDITMKRGDKRTITVTVKDAVGAAYDLTDRIIRAAFKADPTSPNSEALFLKTSYPDGGITIVGPATDGVFLITLKIDDTLEVDPGTYCWDVDITGKDGLVTSAGSVTIAVGSDVLTFVGSDADFAKFALGMVMEPNGTPAANQERVVITGLDASTKEITVEGYSGFDAAETVTHNTYDGDRKTPDGAGGDFILQRGVTT